MGFVNERISDVDACGVDFDYILDPTKSQKFQPRQWCINRDINAFFLYVPRVGRPEPEDPERFALCCDGHIIQLWMFRHREQGQPRRVKWGLDSMFVPKDYPANEGAIVARLKEALLTYKSHGLGLYNELADESILVEFLF